MRKSTPRLVIRRETLRLLADLEIVRIVGGDTANAGTGCPMPALGYTASAGTNCVNRCG